MKRKYVWRGPRCPHPRHGRAFWAVGPLLVPCRGIGPTHATRVTALASLVPGVCVKGLPDATGARACAHDENCLSLPLIDMKHQYCS